MKNLIRELLMAVAAVGAWCALAHPLVVNSTESAASTQAGVITLRDAVNTLVAEPTIVGPDGTRTITFDILAKPAKILLEESIVVPKSVEPFAIDGWNNGRGITIRPKSADQRCRLFDVSGSVTFRNLTLALGQASNNEGGGLILGRGLDSGVSASNCYFYAGIAVNGGGAVVLNGSARSLFYGCTFSNCSLSGDQARSGTALLSRMTAFPTLVNCTFSENQYDDAGTVYSVVFGGGATVVNCTFGDRQHVCVSGYGDVNCIASLFGGVVARDSTASEFKMVGCSFAAGYEHPSLTDTALEKCYEAAWRDLVVNEGAATNITVGAVTYPVYWPVATTEVLENPPYVWYNDSWRNIAYSFVLDASVYERVQLGSGAVGDSAPLLDVDQAGKPIAERGRGAVQSGYWLQMIFNTAGGTSVNPIVFQLGNAPATVPVSKRPHFLFNGWYDKNGNLAYDGNGKKVPGYVLEAAILKYPLKARWTPTQELLVVTTEEDGYDMSDEKVTLREALAAILECPELSPRRISFASNVKTLKVKSFLPVEDPVGTLVLDGEGGREIRGEDMTEAMLRITGNCTLRNLTIRNGPILSRAVIFIPGAAGRTLLVENCAFEDNPWGAMYIGYVRDSGTVTIRNCSFYNNAAPYGAALDVEDQLGLKLTVAHSTFAKNESFEQGAAVTAYGASPEDAIFANCTFIGNKSSAVEGAALYVRSATVVGCVFADNVYEDPSDETFSEPRGLYVIGTPATKLIASTFADGYGKAADATLEASDDLGRGNATAIFKNGTDLLTLTNQGVTHHYADPVPSALFTFMSDGRLLWHDAAWANVAVSKTHGGAKQALRGSAAAADVCCTTDQLGIYVAQPMRGAVTEDRSSILVTRADDTSDVADGRTTLREALMTAALGKLQPSEDGFYDITFGDALFEDASEVTVCLDNLGTIEVPHNVRIRGRAGVTVRVTTDTTALRVPAGVRFELRDLVVQFNATRVDTNASCVPQRGMFVASEGLVTIDGCSFTGENKDNGFVLHSAGKATDLGAVIENCSFTGAGCGGLSLLGSRHYRLVNCTFAGIVSQHLSGVVNMEGLNESLVVNCTVCNCKTRNGGIRLTLSTFNRPYVVNSILAYNVANAGSKNCDFWVEANGGRSYFHNVAYVGGEGPASALMTTNCVKLGTSDEAKVFAGAVRSVTVAGVPRWYRPLSRTGAAWQKGCYVFHDAAWTNVTVRPSLKYQTSGEVVVLGAKGQAPDFLARDIANRPVADLPTTYQQLLDMPDVRAVPGSYAALTEYEEGSAGQIVVNDIDDRLDDAFDPYDGKVMLREAVAYAESHPEWRDADGNCTITFGDAFFGNVRSRVWTGAQRQVEVTHFTNGTLIVQGPADGRRSVVLDGKGTHRFFHVASGNRVRFENLSFVRGLGQVSGRSLVPSGGAILNAGTLTVANALFQDCAGVDKTSEGGAVYTMDGATTRVERCTFEGCSAGRGGALSAGDGGVLTAVASTFLDNTASATSGGAVHVGYHAVRATLASCTFTRNTAATRGGGVASEATAPRVLFLVDDLLVGNSSVEASADLYAAGDVPMVGCWYGARNAERVWNLDVNVTGGKMPADVFSRVESAQKATCVSLANVGVMHQVFPVLKDTDYGTRWVRYDVDWNNLGYSADKSGEVTPLYGDLAPITLRMLGKTLERDQVENPMGNVPSIGALAAYEAPQGRTPVSADDPLSVTTGTFAALQAALEYAVLHPNLASNGFLTVTFASGLTIPVESTIVVSNYVSTGLRLVGPVTLDGQGKVRLFTLAKNNRLRLENVTLANGYAEGKDYTFGGAVLCNDARLEASNCVFRACKAGKSTSQFAYGGAVEFRDTESGAALASGDFTDCQFESCTAQGQVTAARILYRAYAATALRNCRYDGAAVPAAGDIEENLRVRIDRPSVASGETLRLYYGTLSAGLSECRRGDTLVRLDKDVVVPSDLRWPDGVSFSDETASGDPLATTLMTAARNKLATVASETLVGGQPLYCLRETSTQVALTLNPSVVEPDLSGEGSEVDLTGNAAEVTVVPATVVPGLWYGLGRSDTPEGPYVVPEGGWVQADADGLPHALTAPKAGDAGFYRVLVRE